MLGLGIGALLLRKCPVISPSSLAGTALRVLTSVSTTQKQFKMTNPSQNTASFQIVVATSKDFGIGKAGQMPWSLPSDMAYFKRLTCTASDPRKQNAVIMGRKTWESIPSKFRPLTDRINIVLTRTTATDENSPAAANTAIASPQFKGATTCESLESALELLSGAEYQSRVETIFVIGGGQVYREALASPQCAAVHLTMIDQSFDCDTFFPALDPKVYRLWSSSPVHRQGDIRYEFQCYTRVDAPTPATLPPAMSSQHEEQQYLELVERIIKMGVLRGDRTGTGTLSIFGCQARYNLRHNFPLLTTKRVFWRGVVEELLWFVKGSTDAKELQDKGVHIWDGNSSRQYLDSIGLTEREEGDLGPVYGFQWRHFGAEYHTMHDDYTGQGVDQLAEVVHKLKNNPTDRRIIMSAWNPAALRFMALPPCHMFCQFYVAEGELSCLMYQRSCDVGLGVPFNIASYSLLTCMLAQVCGLKPGEFVHCMGDTHVYTNHVEPLQQQLRNVPRHFPTLKINPAKTDIDSFKFDDFELVGYNPHKKIEMKMAV